MKVDFRRVPVRKATDKQKKYANTISNRLGIYLPEGDTFQEYSDWLSENVPKYRELMELMDDLTEDFFDWLDNYWLDEEFWRD